MHQKLLIQDIGHKGFCIIDDFLDRADYESLRHRAIHLDEEGIFQKAKIGQNTQKHQNTFIRTDGVSWLDEHLEHPAVHVYLNQIRKIAHLLNQAFFLGLFELEAHFASYQPGSFYKKHKDQFHTKKTRKMSCVYYLNQEWENDFGGQLNLYSEEDELIQSVSPEGNRFICFKSELTHEVCLTHKARYSIAGWMKTRT